MSRKLSSDDIEAIGFRLKVLFDDELIEGDPSKGYDTEYHLGVMDRNEQPMTNRELANLLFEYILLDTETKGYYNLVSYRIHCAEEQGKDYLMIFLRYEGYDGEVVIPDKDSVE